MTHQFKSQVIITTLELVGSLAASLPLTDGHFTRALDKLIHTLQIFRNRINGPSLNDDIEDDE
jgi:hypothetical protein